MVRAFLIIASLLLALPAWAARVELIVRPETVQVGQTARLQVLIIGAAGVPLPQIDVPEGLTLGNPSQETRKSITSTGVATIQSFTYGVMPVREGVYTIGPFSIENIGETRPATLTVRPRPPAAEEKLTVEAFFDTTTAYEGQVILYTYRLATRVPTAGSPHWQLDSFAGLRPPRDGSRPQLTYALEDEGGDWQVVERHIPYVVNTTGKLSFGSAIAHVDLPNGDPRRDVFGRMVQPTRREVLPTQPLKLDALPLPDAPADFSGLVGTFAVTSSGPYEKGPRGKQVPKRSLRVGESANWTVRITGNGNLEGFELPTLEEEHLSVYRAGHKSNAKVQSGEYQSTGTYNVSLVAAKEGRINPTLSLVTFSPEERRYITHDISLGVMNITPGRTDDGGTLQSFGEALVDPRAEEEPWDMRPAWRSGFLTSPFLARYLPLGLLLAFAPTGVLGGLTAFRVTKARLEDRRNATKKPVPASQHLRHLPDDPAECLMLLDSALRLALAQRAGVLVAEFDRSAYLLTLPEALRDQVTTLQRELDRARFAEEGMGDLTAKVRRLVITLEEG